MDGIPNVLLEAMAMEVPVVSTQVAGIPELIESGTGILVPEKDPEALATAIEELLRDPIRRRELARRGGQVVRERFDRQRTIRQLVEIFSSHGGRPAAGHRPMGACGNVRATVL